MFKQLETPIPMYAVGKGNGLAIATIDYGPEFDIFWVVGLDNGGELWTLPNPEVRLRKNISMGRTILRPTGD